MLQYPLNQHSTAIRFFLVPLFFSGVVACQEEHEPVNMPPGQSNNLPGTSQNPSPSLESRTPDIPKESNPPSLIPRKITGEVISIEGKFFTINDSENKEIRVETNSMTLVDEGIEVGDKAEIRYSADNKPLAITKVRGAL